MTRVISHLLVHPADVRDTLREIVHHLTSCDDPPPPGQYDISRIAALLHRAADMKAMPTMKETKYLLPKAALMVRDIKPPQWVNMVQDSWAEVQHNTTMQAKAAVLGKNGGGGRWGVWGVWWAMRKS